MAPTSAGREFDIALKSPKEVSSGTPNDIFKRLFQAVSIKQHGGEVRKHLQQLFLDLREPRAYAIDNYAYLLTLQISFTQLPECLMIQLSRFQNVDGDVRKLRLRVSLDACYFRVPAFK